MKKYGSLLLVSFFLILLFTNNSISQNISNKISQIAVLPFDGRGIKDDENELLYNQFRGELVRTNAFVVLERTMIEDILNEQAFQQSGCTSTECAVEAGKILNVQKMVTAIIGKIGSTWTVNISLINVESSQIEKSLNKTYRGEIDGLIPILKEIAIAMMPPVEPISDIPLYVSGISAIAATGISVYSIIQASDSYDKYKKATTGESAAQFKSDTEDFDSITIIGAVAAGTATLFYFIYKKYYNDSKIPPQYIALPYVENKKLGLAISINF